MATSKKVKKAEAPAKATKKQTGKPGRFAKAKEFIKNIITEVKKDREARKKAAASKSPKPKASAKPKVAATKTTTTKKPLKNSGNKQAKKATGKVQPQAKSATKQKATKSTTKNAKSETPVTTGIIKHGEDLRLIPVTGELNPAGAQTKKIYEQAFRKHSDTLMQQENMRAKAALATRKHAKAVFRNFRQS